MTVSSFLFGTVVLVAVTLPAVVRAAAEEPPNACYSGAYRLGNDYIVITPSDEGALRYRVPDGRSGRLYPGDDRHFHGGPGWASREPRVAEAVFDGCPGKRIEFRLKDGPSGIAQRVPVTRTPTTFSSIGNTLYGELFAPEKPQALVVMVFGSGQDSAVAYSYVQHLLSYYGIAAFVYDKRGTGKSTGRFTVDFSELADDALAAMAHARTLLNAPGVPVGLMGESQGGWIAPLAAVRAPADFVIVSYGLAISPLEEDRFEVMNELRAKRYDDSVVAKGRELTDITGRIMLSRFTDGLDDLRKFKAAHADAKWLQEVEGDFTGPLLRSPDDQFESCASCSASTRFWTTTRRRHCDACECRCCGSSPARTPKRLPRRHSNSCARCSLSPRSSISPSSRTPITAFSRTIASPPATTTCW